LLEMPPGMSGNEWEAAYSELLKRAGQ